MSYALVVLFTSTSIASKATPNLPPLHDSALDIVVELPFRPGNVSVTTSGRVFATIHPFAGERGVQLIEIKPKGKYQPWPSNALQSPEGSYSAKTIDSPLGITDDKQGGLWIVDMGNHLGYTRIWGFDIETGNVIAKINLPKEIVPATSFVQDLVVDRQRGWIYLADLANPSIISVELSTQNVRRFSDHPGLQPEAGATMIINNEPVLFAGQPAHSGINPITLSDDGETLFFGAMNGTSWYRLPTIGLRQQSSDKAIKASVNKVGAKPISDGATTDKMGIHYFTNLNANGIDILSKNGRLTPLLRDPRLDWPDNVSVSADNWLYISVNQLHKSTPFSGSDKGQAPYFIYRYKLK
ncbi:L-dopachrome tautomerase-related protein [Thalassotalea aquiviva]|uniref:L-dopachrome tautomerase-related protein n=1 Tax=Thalassotalea aquiviva TaxID=3242415 RepID=UPI00352ACDAC